jgi:hypothetical protein
VLAVAPCCPLLQLQRTPAAPGTTDVSHRGTSQVLRGMKYSGRRADIWSCGVVLYTMVSGDYP